MRSYQQLPTIYYVHDRSITPRSPTPGLAPKLGVFRLSSNAIFCVPKAWVEGAVPICQQLQICGLPEILGWFQINLSRKHGQRAVLQFFFIQFWQRKELPRYIKCSCKLASSFLEVYTSDPTLSAKCRIQPLLLDSQAYPPNQVFELLETQIETTIHPS